MLKTLALTSFTKQPLPIMEAVTTDELMNVLRGTWDNMPIELILSNGPFEVPDDGKLTDEWLKYRKDTVYIKSEGMSVPRTLEKFQVTLGGSNSLWDHKRKINNEANFIVIIKDGKIIDTITRNDKTILTAKETMFYQVLDICLYVLSEELTKPNQKIFIREWKDHNKKDVPAYIQGGKFLRKFLPHIELSEDLGESVSGTYFDNLLKIVLDYSKLWAQESILYSTLVHEYEHFISHIRANILKGNETLSGNQAYKVTSSDYDPATNISSISVNPSWWGTQLQDSGLEWNQRFEELQAVLMQKLYASISSNNFVWRFCELITQRFSNDVIRNLFNDTNRFESLLKSMFNDKKISHILYRIFGLDTRFKWLIPDLDDTFTPETLQSRKQAHNLIERIITTWAITNKHAIIEELKKQIIGLKNLKKRSKEIEKAQAKEREKRKSWDYV